MEISISGKFKRLELLIGLIKKRPYMSKEKITAYFENYYSFDYSYRTLERDFKYLQTEIGIQVKYDRSQNGYYLDEEDEEQVGLFLAFAGRLYLASLFRKGLEDFQDLQKTVKLEDFSNFDGILHVEPIFLAIHQKREIHFTHYNYFKESYTPYHLFPIQLREYQGRWYVVGIPLEREKQATSHKRIIKSFGLDRISKLKTGELSNLSKEDYLVQLDKFKQILGLNYDEHDTRELIEIAVKPNQYKYLKSLPLHSSQLERETLPDGRIKISLHLIPNYELKMQLLKFGPEIEILSPDFLREQIKDSLSKALSQYQSEK